MSRLAVIATALLLLGPAGPTTAQERDPEAPVGGWLDRFFGYAAYKMGNYDDARAIWLPLAEAGDPRAQEYVGMLYEHGQGVEADPETALLWYRTAAESGDVTAQYNLGVALVEGRLADADAEEGRHWLEQAAARGDQDAARRLAR